MLLETTETVGTVRYGKPEMFSWTFRTQLLSSDVVVFLLDSPLKKRVGRRAGQRGPGGWGACTIVVGKVGGGGGRECVGV